jgi:hypothetical protein
VSGFLKEAMSFSFVPLGLGQRMTFIAAGLDIEELPAALGRFIDRVLVAGDEAIKRRVKG